MQRILSRGLKAPLVFSYPLLPDTRLERSSQNLICLAHKMLETRVCYALLAICPSQIEILEVSFYPPQTLYLDGCIPILLEPYELADLEIDNAQVEFRAIRGVLEVRVLEQ